MYTNPKLIALLWFIQEQGYSIKHGLRLIQAFINHQAPELKLKRDGSCYSVYMMDYNQATIVPGYGSFYFEY